MHHHHHNHHHHQDHHYLKVLNDEVDHLAAAHLELCTVHLSERPHSECDTQLDFVLVLRGVLAPKIDGCQG